MKPYTPDFVKTLPVGASDPVSASLHAIAKTGPATAGAWAKQIERTASDLERLAATIPCGTTKPTLAELLGTDIEVLTSIERDVVSKIQGLGGPRHTFTAVAAEKCLSRERIRQIHQKGLEKIREVSTPENFSQIFDEGPVNRPHAIDLGTVKIQSSDHAFISYLVLGGIASGKTCVAKSITTQLLTSGTKLDPETKPGAFVIDNKDDNYSAALYKTLKAQNRAEDLITLQLDGDHTINLMFGNSDDIEEQAKALNQFLQECNLWDKAIDGGFWKAPFLRALEATFLQLSAARLNTSTPRPSLKEVLATLDGDLRKTPEDEIENLKNKKQAALLKKANVLIEELPRHPTGQIPPPSYIRDLCALENILGAHAKDTFSLSEILTQGKVVVFNTAGFPAEFARRLPRMFVDRLYKLVVNGDTTRHIILTWEEWGFNIAAEDSDRLPISRSLKIIPVFTAQGIISGRVTANSQITGETSTLLASFGTKVFLNSPDYHTGQYLEKLAGLQKPFFFFPYFSEEKLKPKVPAERLSMLAVSKDRTEAYVAQNTASGLTVTRTYIPFEMPRARSTAGFAATCK